MCPLSCLIVFGILGLSSYAVGTLPDYVSEDANVVNLVVDLSKSNCGFDDPCYHPNCQLKLHSQCSDNDPCCEHCKFKSQGAICHKATHDCDIPEYCTGDKAICPASSYKRNGANCTGDYGRGICISGVCKSFDQPCHEAWKSSEIEPVKELKKCSSGMICLNQTCHQIREIVNGRSCPQGNSGGECSNHGECSSQLTCQCFPAWKGRDCSLKVDLNSSKFDTDKPGKITSVGPEQRDSTSNTTALVGGLVSFVIVVSVIFVVMGFRYLPARIPKDDHVIYPPIHANGNNIGTEHNIEGPTPTSIN